MDISPARSIRAFLRGSNEQDKDFLQLNRVYLQKLAKLESIEWLNPDDATPPALQACTTALKCWCHWPD